jgi:acyl carrier protein
MKLEEQVTSLIRDQFQELESVDLSSNLLECGLDSFAFVELVVKLEYQFKIVFEDEYLNYRMFDCVGDLVAYIESKIENFTQSGH